MKNSIFFVVILFSLGSCRSEVEQDHSRVSISPPEVGPVGAFQSCKAKPQREMTKEDECKIQKLSARCLPSDDCLVSCMSSRDGNKVGGGCEHVCFSALHTRVEPPVGIDDCSRL